MDNPKLITMHTDSEGTKTWWGADDKLHRDDDLPAVEYPSGDMQWFQNGKLHRDNDLPAIVNIDGEQIWAMNGKYHRDNDLPAMIDRKKSTWYQHGKIHRVGGPAIIFSNGNQQWYLAGKIHREDGPAIIITIPNETRQYHYYYLNDKELTELAFKIWRDKKELNEKLQTTLIKESPVTEKKRKL